jgi:hypothetical protein
MTTGGEMMSVLGRTIVVWHSIRVPRGVVDEALALTPYAPANSEMTTHGMYTERMFRLREARIEARRKLRREIAWFCVTLVTSMGLWAAAYAAWRWLVS